MVAIVKGAGALGHRGFLTYTIGNGLSAVGLWVQRLAIGWVAWELTHSEVWVGLIAFVLYAPVLLLSAPFGVMIDRTDPRMTSVIINALMMLWAALLGTVSVLGLMTPALLLAIAALVGVTTAAYAPVRLSIVPSLVPRELLSSAIGINSVIFNLSRLVGPAVGGVVLVAFGPAWAFYINSISYLPLLGALMLVSMRPSARIGSEGGFLIQLLDGLAFARDSRIIRWQLILIGWASLFGRSILELLPVYADRIYAKGAVALGLLSGAAGAGALVAALSVSHLALSPRQLERGTILMILLMGAALVTLTLSDALVFGLVQIALIGFGATGSTILSHTLVQLEVTDLLRGRVSSLWGMASLGGTSFGGLILGGMLERLDVHVATLVTGLVTLAVPVLALLYRRRDVA